MSESCFSDLVAAAAARDRRQGQHDAPVPSPPRSAIALSLCCRGMRTHHSRTAAVMSITTCRWQWRQSRPHVWLAGFLLLLLLLLEVLQS